MHILNSHLVTQDAKLDIAEAFKHGLLEAGIGERLFVLHDSQPDAPGERVTAFFDKNDAVYTMWNIAQEFMYDDEHQVTFRRNRAEVAEATQVSCLPCPRILEVVELEITGVPL